MLSQMLRHCLLPMTVIAAVLSGYLAATSASAAPPPNDPPIHVTPVGSGGLPIIGIGVHGSPWGGGGGGNGAPVGYGGSGGGGAGNGDICGDPTHQAICPAFIQQQKCGIIWETFGYSGVTDPTAQNPILAANSCPTVGAGGAAGPPPPTAAQLAQMAYGELQLAPPVPGRYPSGTLRDGRPYTIVKTNMWFSTSAEMWRSQSKTVCAGPLCATATATPASLSFDPGNGDSSVSCPGPGTTFVRSTDGSWIPGRQPQGCDYMYLTSTFGDPNGELTATYSIRWDVAWTGTNGTAGTLNPMTTATAATFAVAELQSVVTQ